MTADGWRELVEVANRDPLIKALLVRLLTEQDAAKAELHARGYGVTGTPWLDVVREVPPRE